MLAGVRDGNENCWAAAAGHIVPQVAEAIFRAIDSLPHTETQR